MLEAASANDGGSAAPNHVIFFLVDDYGFADASFKSALYPTKGLNPPPTPTFDSLARAGVMLSVLLPRSHWLCRSALCPVPSCYCVYPLGGPASRGQLYHHRDRGPHGAAACSL